MKNINTGMCSEVKSSKCFIATNVKEQCHIFTVGIELYRYDINWTKWRTLMDREILFRAKQVCNNEWIEGYYLNCYYPGNSTDQTGHFIVEYPGKYHEIYLSTLVSILDWLIRAVEKSGKMM